MSTPDYNLKELIQNPSFKRWVQGEASGKERKFWDQWVMEDPANRVFAMKVQEEIEGFALHPAEDTSTDEAWQRIRDKLDEEQKSRRGKLSSRKGLGGDGLTWMYRIAAGILLIATCIFLITQFYQTQPGGSSEIVKREVTTDYGERKVIRLSDGSEIVLNGNSGMMYTIDRNDPTAVDLFLEGEAFFSVSKRENPGDNPFQVRTDEGMVKVLGTQLVVSTRNDRTQVILEEGSVAVSPFHLDSETILKPGQLGEFNNSSDSVKTKFVNLRLYTSWMKGQLHFEKTPLSEVAERLEDTFGVKIILKDSSMNDNKVSGAIESEDLEIITSALSEILNTCIQKSDSRKVIYVGCISE